MKMKHGPRHDPTVLVPDEWGEFVFEYRHGWSWGGVKGVYNPVSAVRTSDKARRAWKAGQKASAKKLHRESQGEA